MSAFLARYRAAVVLGGVFVVAWVLALLATRGDRPAAEDPDRWVQGPPPISGALDAESADAGEGAEDESDAD